jgi:hypothetical protein
MSKCESVSILVSAAVLGLMFSEAANATVIWTDSSTVGGKAVTASASLTISGNTLTISLKNTSPAASLEAPTNTLTGLSFLLNGLDPALTPVSAISPNAIVNSADCDAHPCTGTNVNVGGEWGYQHNFGGKEGLSSAGYLTTGNPGNLGNFNGQNLQDPNSLDGIEFGVISGTHGPFNGGLSSQALIDDTVVLTLTGVSGFTESQIGSVSFLYGTTPDATVPGTSAPPAVPEPATWLCSARHCSALECCGVGSPPNPQLVINDGGASGAAFGSGVCEIVEAEPDR